MIFNENYPKVILVDRESAKRLQWRCCGELLDEIGQRHDDVIGELESDFRDVVGREDEEFEVAWQRLELAIQDMFFEMIAAAFWAGAGLGLRLEVRELVFVGNGRGRPVFGEVV